MQATGKGVLQLTGRKIVPYSGNWVSANSANVGAAFVANKQKRPEVIGFLGVGLDNKDEHKRLTQAESFLLVGGSEETHSRMQEVSIRFNESLHLLGKRLRDATEEEVIEMMQRAMERSSE
jgi:hypothetical protein